MDNAYPSPPPVTTSIRRLFRADIDRETSAQFEHALAHRSLDRTIPRLAVLSQAAQHFIAVLADKAELHVAKTERRSRRRSQRSEEHTTELQPLKRTSLAV